ncbi:hypothetical protein ACQPXS_29125 [Streptomyces sp. CA-142005]
MADVAFRVRVGLCVRQVFRIPLVPWARPALCPASADGRAADG